MTMVWMKMTMIPGMNRYLREKFKIDVSTLREDLKDIVYNQYIKNSGKYLNHEIISQMDNDLGYLEVSIEEVDNLHILEEYRKLYDFYVEALKKYS